MFYTSKLKRIKFIKHKNVLLRSLKHNRVNLFGDGLRKDNFLNYERFSSVLNKLMKVTNDIASS